MNEPMGLGDINNRANNISERGSWYNFIALALFLIAIGIVISALIANIYYSGMLEGLSMLPETEVHHE
jgi:hypothetical protein